MRYRKLLKELKKYPYILDENVRISEKEALKAVRAHDLPDFAAVVAAAKGKSDLPPEAWASVDEAVALQQKHKKARSPQAVLSRRLVFAALALLLFLFFTLTPVGRTWALDAWNFAVRVFSGRIEIERESDAEISDKALFDTANNEMRVEYSNETENQTYDYSLETHYMDIASFSAAKGKDPITLKSDEARLVDAYSTEDPQELMFVSDYISSSGIKLRLSQSWSGESQSIYQRDKDAKWHEIAASQGKTMYWTIDAERNSFDGVIIAKDYLFSITTDASVDINSIVEIMVIP